MATPFPIGPVETLARLAMQSDRYVNDRDFRNAVDTVFNVPVFDAAPDLLVALIDLRDGCRDDAGTEALTKLLWAADAAIAKSGV